jgi:SNF2 family DNA or RNA helicase
MTKLNSALRQLCYLRREKKDVLKELPAKQRTIIHLELSNLSEYNRKVKEILRHSKDEDFSLLGGLEQLRLMVGLGKLQGVQNWVETFMSTGSKLVLFAEHVEVQRKLLALWPNSAHILGEDSSEVRNQQVHRFQTDPSCQLMICSLKAAGVGITLTAASNVAFVELGWTSAEHDQAEDRVHRIGQTQPVNCWYLLAPKTVDEYAYSMIEGKRSVVEAATAGQVDSTPTQAGEALLALLRAQAA